MQRNNPAACRACEASVHMTREQIRLQVQRLLGSGIEPLSDPAYQRRLDACESCGDLLYGSTCGHCGCIVPVRAMQPDRNCPHPAGDRWGMG